MVWLACPIRLVAAFWVIQLLVLTRLAGLVGECSAAVLAIGQLDNSSQRVQLSEKLNDIGFLVLISPYVAVSQHAQLGVGTTIGHGVIVNACSVVGLIALLIVVY